jgi:hypothetical protein
LGLPKGGFVGIELQAGEVLAEAKLAIKGRRLPFFPNLDFGMVLWMCTGLSSRTITSQSKANKPQ